MKFENWEVGFLVTVVALIMLIAGISIGGYIGFTDGVKATVQITGACK